MTYLSPTTADNHELRQALSYFFPVYCYSARNNQRCVQKVVIMHTSVVYSPLKFESQIFIPSFEKLSNLRNDLDDDEEMVSAAQVGNMFVDWTDPQKVMCVQNLCFTNITD
jgi:condensin complex subunit 3